MSQTVMLTCVDITNFKSVKQLSMNVGRVNVFIGENGSGKSNILEALTFAGAAQANKLDNEFLVSRGIRVTEPQLMRSGFNSEDMDQQIQVKVDNGNGEFPYILTHDNQPYSKWIYKAIDVAKKRLFNQLKEILKKEPQIAQKKLEDRLNVVFDRQIKSVSPFAFLSDFITYSPENTALRNFYSEGQIEPLGINGEGLLRLIKYIHETNPEQMVIINGALELFGWYESMQVPTGLDKDDDSIRIKDRYLEHTFDQRSANEGFLFVLFYVALLVSDKTPKVFAIDNIDASLNPKLCTKLITVIAKLAQQFDKQVFLTTHNPAILDGLNLNDSEQKLFVVSRNKSGHTRVKTIDADDMPKSSDDEPVRLSEAFLRGYLGALPKGF
jgi:predicted ATPase